MTKTDLGNAHELSTRRLISPIQTIMLQPAIPGEYVEECPDSTPSVNQLRTDIPAFVGITEPIPESGTDCPVRILH